MDALVLAGGRISGAYARAAGTEIKALAPVGGAPVLHRVLAALRESGAVGKICVVGPEAVRDALIHAAEWELEGATAIDNLRGGLARLGGGERVLLCGSDLPAITAAAVAAFVERAPEPADVAMPIVHRGAYVTSFPGERRAYVRLAEGHFTGGSQFVIRPEVLLANLSLVEQLFARRKSQLAMARALGGRVLWRLVSGRLAVAELEERLSAMTGCRCRAVLDCHPELACDIDSLHDFRLMASRVCCIG